VNHDFHIPAPVRLATEAHWGDAVICRAARGDGRHFGPIFVLGAYLVQRVSPTQAVVHKFAGIDFQTDEKLQGPWAGNRLNGLTLSLYTIGDRRVAYLRSVRTAPLDTRRPGSRRVLAHRLDPRWPHRRSRRSGTQLKLSTTTAAAAVAATLVLASCASKNKLVTPDGSERTSINTPESLSRYRDLVARDEAMALEKSTLERKVDALSGQVEALKLYLIQEQRKSKSTEDASKDQPRTSTPPPTYGEARPTSPESKNQVDGPSMSSRVVFRVTHGVGETAFAPSDALEANLLRAAQEASSIVIRGRTDADSVDAVETRIARDRALQARAYLIRHGVPPDKIRTWYRAAGGTIAENSLAAGRALNRRVEIEVRGLNAAAVAAAKSGIRATSTL
jgi:outer membrane protein OmpA-like peptidoglycan-associated protein